MAEFMDEGRQAEEMFKLRRERRLLLPRSPETAFISNWPKGSEGATYSEKAIEHRKTMGYKAPPIIDRKKNAREWAEWRAYFRFRGMTHALENMDEKAKARIGYTVPELSPLKFDAEFTAEVADAYLPEPSLSNNDEASYTPHTGRFRFKSALWDFCKTTADKTLVADAFREGMDSTIAVAEKLGFPVPDEIRNLSEEEKRPLVWSPGSPFR
jgi:hypothetical protein